MLSVIVQGLYQIMEPKATIKCRQADQQLVQGILPKAAAEYKSKIGKDVVITLDTESFLPPDACGGVELVALNGRVRVSLVDFFLFKLYFFH